MNDIEEGVVYGWKFRLKGQSSDPGFVGSLRVASMEIDFSKCVNAMRMHGMIGDAMIATTYAGCAECMMCE